MAGRYLKVLIVPVAALVLVASASAASPDVAAMNLQLADVPGAKVAKQQLLTEKGYVAAHYRVFTFAVPSGSARLYQVESETKLASSAATPTAEIARTEKYFRSTARPQGLHCRRRQGPQGEAQGRDGGARCAACRATTRASRCRSASASRACASTRTSSTCVSTASSCSWSRADCARSERAVTAKFASAIAGHIGTELTPITVTPPTITGTAQQGQTLTATPGTWTAPDATFGYQWQRCDAAGANCVAVPGATTSTYAVTAADVGNDAERGRDRDEPLRLGACDLGPDGGRHLADVTATIRATKHTGAPWLRRGRFSG